MLLEFTAVCEGEGRTKLCWINPEHVSLVESGPGPAIHLHSGKTVMALGDVAAIARRIQAAMMELQLQRTAVPAQPTHAGPSFNPYQSCTCRHCGHRYAENSFLSYVCGALPRCPVCNKTQTSWEGASGRIPNPVHLGDHIRCVFCNEYHSVDLSQPPKPCPKCGRLQADWKKETT